MTLETLDILPLNPILWYSWYLSPGSKQNMQNLQSYKGSRLVSECKQASYDKTPFHMVMSNRYILCTEMSGMIETITIRMSKTAVTNFRTIIVCRRPKVNIALIVHFQAISYQFDVNSTILWIGTQHWSLSDSVVEEQGRNTLKYLTLLCMER